MMLKEPVDSVVNENVNHYILVEDGIMIMLIALSLLGIGIMDISPTGRYFYGYFYWIAMILVFGAAAMIISFVQAKRGKHIIQEIWQEQSLLWLGVLAALSGTLLLQEAGVLQSNNTSLVILLLLSLACYIDGIRIGWRFSLVGNFLGLTAVSIAYLDNFMWTLYALAAITIGLTIYVDRRWLGRKTGQHL